MRSLNLEQHLNTLQHLCYNKKMKKLLIVILVIGGLFILQDKEKYLGLINQQIDTFVPERTQILSASLWNGVTARYTQIELIADRWRKETKEWSLDESINLIAEISNKPFTTSSRSFSPILDNTSTIFSPLSSITQKLYAVFLFIITLLFWNFQIFAVWVCLLLYVFLKSIRRQLFPKRKKSFFDKINDNVKKELDADWD